MPQGVPHPADARREQSIDKHGVWLIPRDRTDNRYGQNPPDIADVADPTAVS